MEQILAYRELFKELGICNLCDIGIAIVLFISYCIVVHCLLQGRSDTYIVDDKTAFLIAEDSVDTGNGLHQVVALHRFIDIHCCKRWYIKARQPHIYDNGNFQRAVIILEFLCQFVFVVLVSNDFYAILLGPCCFRSLQRRLFLSTPDAVRECGCISS